MKRSRCKDFCASTVTLSEPKTKKCYEKSLSEITHSFFDNIRALFNNDILLLDKDISFFTNANMLFDNDVRLVRNERPLSNDNISLADNTNALFSN